MVEFFNKEDGWRLIITINTLNRNSNFCLWLGDQMKHTYSDSLNELAYLRDLWHLLSMYFMSVDVTTTTPDAV